MNDFEYKSLRQRALERDMTDVCQDLGIELGTRGRWRECRCPNPHHEDRHPSCRINVSTNRFYCFSCGEHGNNIDLVRLVLNCSYNEAVRFILGDSSLSDYKYTPKPLPAPPINNLDIKWLRSLVSPREYYKLLDPFAKAFFNNRRINPNLIDMKAIVSITCNVATQRWKNESRNGKLYIPTFPAPSLLFPYRNEDDIIINLQARLDNPQKGQNRFYFPPGSQTSLWNPRDALILPDGSDMWICEGVSDALALMSSGRPALAIASATSLTHEASEFIAQQSTRLRLHIYPDNDAPGAALYTKLLTLCPNLRCHHLPDGIKDFGQAWSQCAIDPYGLKAEG